jgi:hypothetical protein
MGVDLHVLRNELLDGKYTSEALTWHGMSGDIFFVDVEEGSVLPHAPFRLERDHAQTLMDDLYRAGLRPADARATQGQIEAVQYHLEDMRKLVFKA